MPLSVDFGMNSNVSGAGNDAGMVMGGNSASIRSETGRYAHFQKMNHNQQMSLKSTHASNYTAVGS